MFNYFGLPECIQTDKGAQFHCQQMKELCALWGIKKSSITPYHPQGNVVAERGSRDIGDALRSTLIDRDDSDWHLVFPYILRSLRATPNASTGETHNFLLLERELRLPDTLISGPQLPLSSRHQYVFDAQERLTVAHNKLRDQQKGIQSEESIELLLYTPNELVLVQSRKYRKGTAQKLQTKNVHEHESKLKLHTPSQTNWGNTNPVVEPVNQPTRAGYKSNGSKRSTDGIGIDIEIAPHEQTTPAPERATPPPQPLISPNELGLPPEDSHTPA